MDQLPDVGIIYNRQKHAREVSKIVKLLQQLADKYRMSIKLFSIDKLNLTEETVGGLLIKDHSTSELQTGIPALLYNLALHSKSASIEVMRQLRVSPLYRVINPINRFNQTFVYDILSHSGQFADVVLPYRPFRPASVQEDLNLFDKMMVVPEKALYYRRAVLLERTETENGRTAECKLTIGQDHQYHELSKLPDVLSFMLKDQAFVRVALGDLLSKTGCRSRGECMPKKTLPAHGRSST